MNKTLSTFIGLALAASVQAAPITFTDIVNPAPDILLKKQTPTETYTYLHNIVDNGFVSATDAITSADMYISLRDDGDQSAENVRITFDDFLANNLFQVTAGTHQFSVNTSLLQSDGQVSVTLQVIAGDFYFEQSRLEVAANRTTAPAAVPEPGTMALMGLGIAGLAFAARRKKA